MQSSQVWQQNLVTWSHDNDVTVYTTRVLIYRLSQISSRHRTLSNYDRWYGTNDDGRYRRCLTFGIPSGKHSDTLCLLYSLAFSSLTKCLAKIHFITLSTCSVYQYSLHVHTMWSFKHASFTIIYCTFILLWPSNLCTTSSHQTFDPLWSMCLLTPICSRIVGITFIQWTLTLFIF